MTIHDNVAAYAVDALDLAERIEFEDHLNGCAQCRREVGELTEAATELSLLRPATPPPNVRAAVLAAIAQVPQLPAEGPGAGDHEADRAESSRPSSHRPAFVERPMPPLMAPSETLTLGSLRPEPARRESGRRNSRGSWIVAAALTLVVGLSGWVYATSQRRAADAVAQQLAVQRQTAQEQAAAQAALLAARDVRTYPTTLPDGQQVAFVVSQEHNRAMFVGPDLPAAGPGRQYQLWTIHAADDIRPDAVFDGNGTTTTFFSGVVTGAAQLAVTIEPSGGSVSPTLPVQASASL